MFITQSGLTLPKVFANSVPKSGTNLLMQVILGIPGITLTRDFYDDTILGIAGTQPGEMAYGHVAYSPQIDQWLRANQIKHVFIYRDLRDVIVSMTHFIQDKFHQHPLYPYFTDQHKSWDEQILALIQGVHEDAIDYPSLYDEYRQIYDWVRIPQVCCVRYEDLVRDAESRYLTVERMTDFLFANIRWKKSQRELFINRMIQNINPSQSWTFREGKIGGWRLEFSSVHKEAFKHRTADLLIDLGYEQDNDW